MAWRAKNAVKKVKKEHKHKDRRAEVLREYESLLEYKGRDYSIIQVIAIVLKRKKGVLALMSLLVCICCCLFFYTLGSNKSTVTMMFNYEESSKRLAPNHTRYNIADFTSEAVLDNAIQKAGLNEDVLTAQELAERIEVKETYNRKPVDNQNYYIPTSYKIYYKNPWRIRHIKTDDMLAIICNSYTDFFYEQYTMKPKLLKEDYSIVSEMEYNEIASFFSMRIDELTRYLGMRNQESGKFKSEETGETFNSLRKMVANVRDYALRDYKAYIWENGIVKERMAHKNTLLYLNDDYEESRIKNFNEYLIRKDIISYYSTPMSTSILIPAENQKNDYYMARTKTGVDYLASEAERFLSTAKYFDLKMAENKDKYAKIKDTTPPERIGKADEMVESIRNELSRIEKIALTTDKDYTYDKSRNYITFKFSERSISDSLPKKKIIFITALFFLTALFAFYKECSSIIKRGGVK